jgi:23S rRNA (cytosine1962-C5)-methyltransferase
MAATVVITHRGEERVRAGHLWVYRGDLADVRAEGGDIVWVLGARGRRVGQGLYSDRSEIALRMLTQGEVAADRALWHSRVCDACAYREALEIDSTAYRLVHAEADRLPSLIVDRYGDYLVVQALSQAVERLMPEICDLLIDRLAPIGILARNDARVRLLEGLPQQIELLYGEVPDQVVVREAAIEYEVNLKTGQKTGLFLDQRDKRRRISELSHAFTGRSQNAPTMLNCFAYTGGFALAGLDGNPALHTVNVESSGPALELARRNYPLNGHDPAAHGFEDMDVIRYLDRSVDTGLRFDIVVLDPPAFAKTQRDKERALRAYEHLNQLGARVVTPGGLLLTSSCSGAVDFAEFEGTVRAGLLRAERQAQILEIFTSSLDHPTLPAFPEDRYLKALLLRVL